MKGIPNHTIGWFFQTNLIDSNGKQEETDEGGCKNIIYVNIKIHTMNTCCEDLGYRASCVSNFKFLKNDRGGSRESHPGPLVPKTSILLLNYIPFLVLINVRTIIQIITKYV